jgi:antitoxin component of RelBE/YafQ-DinJ toxin-antitoxin module
MNNIPAATKIDADLSTRAGAACKATRLRMADLLRIGLERVLKDFEKNKSLRLGVTPHKKGGKAK